MWEFWGLVAQGVIVTAGAVWVARHNRRDRDDATDDRQKENH